MSLVSRKGSRLLLSTQNRAEVPKFGQRAFNEFEARLNRDYTKIDQPSPNMFNLLALHEIYKASPDSLRQYAIRMGTLHAFINHCTELQIKTDDGPTLSALFDEFKANLPSEEELLQSYETLMAKYTQHFENALAEQGVESEKLQVIAINFGENGPEFLLEDTDNPGFYSVFKAGNNGVNHLHLLSKQEEMEVIQRDFAGTTTRAPSATASAQTPAPARAETQTRPEPRPQAQARSESPAHTAMPKPKDTDKHTLASGSVASRAAMFDAPKPSSTSSTAGSAPAAPTRKASSLADRTAKFNSQANQTAEAAPPKKASKWAVDTTPDQPASRREKTAEEKAAYAKRIGTHSAGKAAEITEREPDPTPTSRGPGGR